MQKKAVILPIIIFISMISGWSQDVPDQGKKWMQEQEYNKALAVFESCLSQDTANYKCKEQAGLAAYRMGNTSKAKKYFHELEKDPDHFKLAAITLSNIYEQQENIPKALKYNNLLSDSFPENAIYYRKIANLLIKAGLPKEAFPKYSKALSLNPDDVLAIRGVAEIFIDNNQFDDADSILQHGLEVDSTNIGLSLLQARNYYKQRMYDSTVVVLYALRGKIDFSNYFNKMLGYSLIQIDSAEQSIYYLEKSLVNEGDPEYAHYYLANAYEILGDIKSAKFHLEKAIETGTSQGLQLYHRNLARIYNEEDDLKTAIPHYEWALKYTDDPVLLFYLARAADRYYADKNIAINYYTRYINSKDLNEDYKRYARDRKRYLREEMHQRSN